MTITVYFEFIKKDLFNLSAGSFFAGFNLVTSELQLYSDQNLLYKLS